MISITFKYRYRKQIICISLIVIVISLITVPLVINYKPKEKKQTSITIGKKEEQKELNENVELLKVDIKGQVVNPGIYTVSSKSRVIDVIEMAGGLTQVANTTVINLSKKVIDEMVIIVYSNDEVANFTKTKEIEEQVQESCIQKDESSLKNDACIKDSIIDQTKVSLNKATLELLESLPGIGESKAKDIISYREENGPYQKIEDIKNVSGIGESLFAKIKDLITT